MLDFFRTRHSESKPRPGSSRGSLSCVESLTPTTCISREPFLAPSDGFSQEEPSLKVEPTICEEFQSQRANEEVAFHHAVVCIGSTIFVFLTQAERQRQVVLLVLLLSSNSKSKSQ